MSQFEEKSGADNWRDPTISLTEKLNRHIDRKRNTGVLSNARQLNAVVPWFFFFVYLGGSAWDLFAAVPFHYRENVVRLVLVEIFFIYVIVQVFVNWFLTCYTTSPYTPVPGYSHGDHLDEQLKSPEDTTPEDKSRDDSREPNGDGENARNLRERSGLTYRVLVVTEVTGSTPKRESVPYWSWVPCFTCRRPRPPRCHHCTLCKHCVLKRDHHCYFTRNCIGAKNQRYFICFLIWCVVLCVLSCFQLISFLFQEILSKYSYWDIVTPYNIYRVFSGGLPFLYCHLIIVTWGVMFLTVIAVGMCGNSVYLLLKGLTKFESTACIKITDTRSTAERIRSVMGMNWAADVFIPGASSIPFIKSQLPPSMRPSDPLEDAVRWPCIKP